MSHSADVFQNLAIHEKWESVYRDNPTLDEFNERLLDRILESISPVAGASVLDAGCGSGAHSFRFAARGFETTGFDVSKGMLEIARKKARDLNLDVEFKHGDLIEGTGLEGPFDMIHCRGVLMHISQWRKVAQNLAGRLHQGGSLVIIENNHRSVEMRMVRMVRHLRRRKRRMIINQDGIEFHDSKQGFAPLTRAADVRCLLEELRTCGLEPRNRFASEFVDINRFRAGIARSIAIQLNRVYFGFHLPATLACGNVLIATKR